MGKRKKKPTADDMRSGFEVTILKQLSGLQAATEIEKIEYETEKLKYIVEHDYTPDFIIYLKSGRKIYVEAKGYFRAEDRSKLLKVREAHPSIDLRIVFQSNGKIHKLSKTRYADWCEKNNFIYSVGGVPKEWFID